MFKTIQNRVWSFDLEWVPDPLAGKLVHGLDESTTEPAEIMRHMWDQGGATDDDPTPFLKTVLCRVAHFAGHFSDQAYAEEQQRVADLILAEIENGRPHLKTYLDEWQRLRELVATREQEP